MENIIKILVLLVFCSSCKKTEKEILLLSSEIKLNTTDYPNETIMNNPTGIMIIDNALYLFQTGGNETALVIDKKNGKLIKNWGYIGNGPGEFIFPKTWGEKSDRIYLHDQNRFTIREYKKEKKDNYTELILTKESPFEKTSFSLSNGTVLENGNFVSCNLYGTKKSLLLLDNKLDSLNNFGGISNEEEFTDLKKYYGTLSSYKNQFVFAMNNLGYIACYEQLKNNDIELKWEHYLEKPIYIDNSLQIKSLKRGFVDVVMTKNYIFCVYSGKKYAVNGGDDQPENILMFKHNGELINNFNVNRKICKIAVSEEDKEIYMACIEPEISIIKADISKYVR